MTKFEKNEDNQVGLNRKLTSEDVAAPQPYRLPKSAARAELIGSFRHQRVK